MRDKRREIKKKKFMNMHHLTPPPSNTSSRLSRHIHTLKHKQKLPPPVGGKHFEVDLRTASEGYSHSVSIPEENVLYLTAATHCYLHSQVQFVYFTIFFRACVLNI